MIEVQGKYNSAKVFIDNVEETAISQIINLLNQPFVDGATLRIMSDVHAGAGCVIGFTADLRDMVVPNLIGVDIGCGMLVTDITDLHVEVQARLLVDLQFEWLAGLFLETGLLYLDLIRARYEEWSVIGAVFVRLVRLSGTFVDFPDRDGRVSDGSARRVADASEDRSSCDLCPAHRGAE